jgi:hypothetical protein
VRQIYAAYFREFFGDKSGRDREAACTLEKRTVQSIRREKRFLSSGKVSLVVEKARTAGHIVEVIASGGGKILRGHLLINGHRCSVHSIGSACKTSPHGPLYAQSLVYRSVLAEVDFVIFHTYAAGYPERTFIVPSETLLCAYFARSDQKLIKHVNIPLERRRPRSGKRVDYWLYEEAWRLLSPK